MPKKLYHTTSLRGLLEILRDHAIDAKNGFVSFSEIPFVGDISANDVTMVFDGFRLAPQLDKVEYSETWYDAHPEQAAYVAGEGWQEQYTEPEDCYDRDSGEDEEDDWEEPDEECLEAAWREAELSSFMYKDAEREWVSRAEGVAVPFAPEDLTEILIAADRQMDAVEGVLDETNFSTPVAIRQAGTRIARVSENGGAGILFTDGARILLLQRSQAVDQAGTWVIPGGACKVGEDPRDAAYRETMEEIGQVPPHTLLDWYVLEQPFEEKDTPLFTTFLAEVAPTFVEGFLGTLDNESTSWGWFNKEEVDQLPLHSGLRILLDRTNPFFSSMHHASASKEELEQLPMDLLDRLAFGITEGVHRLPLSSINIKYEDDYKNAVDEIEEGLWVPNDTEEPIDVSLERGVYWLEDGHHRYVNAQKQGLADILANLQIKDNPVRALMQKRTSETVDDAVRVASVSVESASARALPPPMDAALAPFVDKLVYEKKSDPEYAKPYSWVLGQAAKLIQKLVKMGGTLPGVTTKLVNERDDLAAKLEVVYSTLESDPRGSAKKMVGLFDDFYARTVPEMEKVSKPSAGFLGMDLGIFNGLLQGSAEKILLGWHQWFEAAARTLQAQQAGGAVTEDARGLVKDLAGDKPISDLERLVKEKGEKMLQQGLKPGIQPSQPEPPADLPPQEQGILSQQLQQQLQAPEDDDEPVPLTKVKTPAPGSPTKWQVQAPTTEKAPTSEKGTFKIDPTVFRKLLQQRTT